MPPACSNECFAKLKIGLLLSLGLLDIDVNMQFSRYRSGYLLTLVGLSGPFLSSERLCFIKPNGLKWTRTTDLTLIRRAL